MLDKTKPYGRKRGTCADCGGVMWRGTTSLPQGQAKCQPCRDLKTKPYPSCIDCGATRRHRSISPRCMACAVARRPRGKGKDRNKRLALNRRRQARLREAPGLSQNKRYALLAKWKRQGRACTYCPARATTVDHVIPVSLGGTNYEGNLTPACRSCNGRKNDSLLIEFRRKLELAA